MKKLSAFFVALICASSIFAADYNCEIRGICYGLDTTDMTAEVIKNYYLTTRLELDLYSGSIVIPSKITYKKQTYSVTKIGIGAFAWCDGLKSVKIPNSVTTIGDGTFFVCSGLKSVTIPNSVTTIGERAFYNVNNIVYEGAATGSPWGAKCINGYRRGNLIYSDASKTTLCGCSSTAKGKVTIPNSVTTIGDGAFFVCSGLKSVIIPNSVTTIGDYAFAWCDGLKSITCYAITPPKCWINVFNDERWNIGNVFGTINVYVPASALEDYQNARGWKNLQILPITEDVKNSYYCASSSFAFIYRCKIGDIYYNLNTKEKTAEVTSETGDWRAKSYTGSVVIPETVTYNGITYSVTTIGERAFVLCDGLKSVTIPNSVTTIGDLAFGGCSGLTSATIGKSVTIIGNEAFASCSDLPSITCYAITPPKCGVNVFGSIESSFFTGSSIKVYIPASAVKDYQNADGWKDLQILPITGEVKNSH